MQRNSYQVFSTKQGNLLLENLSIQNSKAKGQNGGNGGSSTNAGSGAGGGGGGCGAGGALFGSNTAQITIKNSEFVNNLAQGGDGGQVVSWHVFGGPSGGGLNGTSAGAGQGNSGNQSGSPGPFGGGGAGGIYATKGSYRGGDGGIGGGGGGGCGEGSNGVALAGSGGTGLLGGNGSVGSPHVGNRGGPGGSGGGGAGLGGALFIDNSGSLILSYDHQMIPFSQNSVQKGAAGRSGASDGQQLGKDIMIMSGGNLTFEISSGINLVLANPIESDREFAGGKGGIFTKDGPDTLDLSNLANTYTANETFIKNGKVIITDATNLGSVLKGTPNKIHLKNSGELVINGSTIIDRELILSKDIGSVESGTISVTPNNEVTWAGVISNNGNLQKDGEGKLILTGKNNYTGVTTITTGTLEGTTDSIRGDVLNNGSLILIKRLRVLFWEKYQEPDLSH